MDDYAGRVLADRYRLPLPPSDEYELAESRAFDTYSGQEVLVRQVPLPEIVEAEVLDEDDLPEGFVPRAGAGSGVRRAGARTTRRPTDPAVRRAMEAAQTAAQIPDHPRLDQVFDVFAEGGSLWIVSELVAARPLAALLADRPLSPYRAAEVAADVLAALRVLHAYGWVHRNITARTVLICDDGRVMLTGLAAGAAEEALCGYDPRPVEAGEAAGSAGSVGNVAGYEGALEPSGAPGVPAARRPFGESRYGAGEDDSGETALDPAPEAAGRDVREVRGGRTGAVAAYRAGTRAAARVKEEESGREGGRADDAGHEGDRGPGTPGHIADPYGVAGRTPWHGAVPRGGVPGARSAEGPGTEDLGGEAADSGRGGAYPDASGRGGRSGAYPDASGRGGRSGAYPDAPGRSGAYPAGPGRGGLVPTDSGRDGAYGNDVGRGGAGPGGSGRGGSEAADSGRGGWDDPVAEGTALRGPTTALAAERARHARMVVVGAVTERWAPEQAGPVHENWQLAAPIGPATDLWALGALLFRAVQGHAPYPEDSTAELVQLVCAEPPAFAEECGPLRPVVESLLRQDPTERLDFEELSGWLRSLVRSAPEPEAGAHVVPVPPYDAGRLPVVRRRGEVVRKRRGAAAAAGEGQGSAHGRHKRGKGRGRGKGGAGREMRMAAPPQASGDAGPVREPRLSHESGPVREARPRREPRPPRDPRRPARPRSLGRLLLVAVLLGLAAAVVYAMVFMPKSGDGGAGDRAGEVSSAPDTGGADPTGEEKPGGGTDQDKGDGEGDGKGDDQDKDKPGESPGSQEPQTSGPEIPRGFTLRKDPAGFHVAIASGWDRQPKNGRGQVRYTHGDFEVLVVPGRDTTDGYGSDPMKYQREHERELQPFRDSSWATSSGMRRIEVGGRAMAEGQFTWQDDAGREVYVRNLAMVVGGKYHVVQVRGPEAERDEVTRLYEQASTTYKVTG